MKQREIIVWISAFATFLAILSSVAMSVLLINEGASSVVRPYIIGDIIGSVAGDLSVEVYLWISVIVTFILIGITCLAAFHKPFDEKMLRMLVNVNGNLEDFRKTHEGTMTEMADQLEYNQKINQTFFMKVNSKVEDASKEMLALLGGQGRAIKKARHDLISIIENKTNETGGKLSSDLKEQRKVMMGVKQLSENGASTLKKQRVALKEIKVRLGKIEEKIMPIQAKLKSVDNPEDIKGIGPTLGKELRGLGITSVGEFLTTEPTLIGEKTRVSQEMADNLQSFAQLLMIPGIDENDAELLMSAGIKSRKELAAQDLIKFSRKVGEIAKGYVDEGKISKDEYPTMEEIYSWIRMAS